MAKAYALNVDPSIRACARSLIVEAMEAIEADRIAGVEFYQARDRALETRAAEWVRLYGKECADMAVRGLHALQEREILSREAKAAIQAQRSARALSRMRRDGTASWVNRLCLRLVGVPLYGLVLAFLAAGSLVTPVPASAGSGQHVDAKWRALAACGVSKPGPGRERACRQFNSADRATFRNYDGLGAGAPRDWELPRAWE